MDFDTKSAEGVFKVVQEFSRFVESLESAPSLFVFLVRSVRKWYLLSVYLVNSFNHSKLASSMGQYSAKLRELSTQSSNTDHFLIAF